MLRVASFNVNGIRAAERRGFRTWFAERDPDILGIQEMRCPAGLEPAGVFGDHHVAYHPGRVPGRNGVAVVSRVAPSAVRLGFGHAASDAEGRYLEVDLELASGPLTVGSLYLPKGASPHAVDPDLPKFRRKLRFLAAFRRYLVAARRTAAHEGREFLVMGDFNIAHTRADLRNWRGAGRTEGFLPEDRAWFDSLLGPRTLHDVVRRVHPDVAGPYSWWSWLPGAFERDTGWRIDYQLATPGLARAALAASVDREGSAGLRLSDHAPVVVDYDA